MFGRVRVNDPDNTMGNDSQHHTTPCSTEDQANGRPWWAGKKNPMGWGDDNPRAPRDTRPTMHGSQAEWRLMSGTGGVPDRFARGRVPAAGDRPGRNSRGTRPGRKS
jgi:hypothetical protein